MFILAFDTSVNACSVALWHKKQVLYDHSQAMTTGSAEALLPMIAEALRITQLTPQQLDAIAVTTGPGSFTGIRISLSAAKALGLSLNIPVIGLSTFTALANSFAFSKQYSSVGVIIETKRCDFYFQLFDQKIKPLSQMFYASSDELKEYAEQNALKKIPLIGDGAERFFEESNGHSTFFKIKNYKLNYPSAAKIAETADQSFLNHQPLSSIKPLYLRPPEVTLTSKI